VLLFVILDKKTINAKNKTFFEVVGQGRHASIPTKQLAREDGLAVNLATLVSVSKHVIHKPNFINLGNGRGAVFLQVPLEMFLNHFAQLEFLNPSVPRTATFINNTDSTKVSCMSYLHNNKTVRVARISQGTVSGYFHSETVDMLTADFIDPSFVN